MTTRWKLSRAGLLNVWQYDDQVFDFADGRLLLRGTNGAGKSKTLEMLLPFVLDGDRARMDASGKRGSLTFLMLDGYDGTSRIGYLWLELTRTNDDGEVEHVTAGIGLKAAASTKTVSLWCFLLPGQPIALEDATGTPLSPPACREAVTAAGGEYFDSPRAYKAAVGRELFGLDEAGYDDLLRLLYWLRSPQVGESVEVSQLDRTLSDSLPELDRAVVDAAAASLDELQELGEQLQRRQRQSEEVQRALDAYRRYAAGEVRRRAAAAVEATDSAEKARRAHRRAVSSLEAAVAAVAEAERRTAAAMAGSDAARERKAQLESSQEARDLEALEQMRLRVETLHRTAADHERAVAEAQQREAEARTRLVQAEGAVVAQRQELQRRAQSPALRSSSLPVPSGAPDEWAAQLDSLGSAVSTRQAAVQVCLEAVGSWETALAAQQRADEQEAACEARVAAAAESMSARRGDEEQARGELGRAVADWLVGAPVDGVPATDAEAQRWALEVTSAPLQQLHQESGRLASVLTDLAGRRIELVQQRGRIEAERDPAPPAPVLDRDDREDALALWQVVDLSPGLPADEAARLEAALQSSGLLDALVLPSGRLTTRDSAVVLGAPVEGRSLADVLVPAGDLPAAVVLAALRSVALDGDGPAVCRLDGSWVLGALEGRATKPEAQYLGVVARAAERVRRLAAVDAELDALADAVDAAERDREAAAASAAALQSWRDAAPSPASWIAAAAAVDAAERQLEVESVEHARATAAAQAQRTETANRHSAVARLADEHALPSDRAGLEQTRQVLQEARFVVEGLKDRLGQLLEAAAAVEDRRQDAHRAAYELATAVARRDEAVRESEGAAARFDARREALSATQAQLQQALAEAGDEMSAAQQEEKAAHAGQITAASARTHAEDEQARREELLAEAERVAGQAEQRAQALRSAPGLLAAVGVSAELDWGALQAAVAGLPVADSNAVFQAHQALLTGSAGALQPTQNATPDGLVVLSIRDESDGADLPLAEVAQRLAVRVAEDDKLLTRQHREVCERHLLGELGEVLRRRRLEATELVDHMNRLLDGVRTSQGIRARLDWKLRDDLAEEARGTVKLLERPIGSLLPEQRERLLGLLSDLIESGRRDNPDGSYADHLRDALDYRRWSSFAVRIRRAGSDVEEKLTRRTALSQGEQKVVCYLPLFAAAAAHFSSLATTAPHAPRFVLLDDAFPKIDVRTHPVLFGLLVDLDLDWLITSERLWGDCDTVPAAAIYEVIRSPTERGVLPFKHLWDGRRLTAVGT